jgi:hypothetical protein
MGSYWGRDSDPHYMALKFSAVMNTWAAALKGIRAMHGPQTQVSALFECMLSECSMGVDRLADRQGRVATGYPHLRRQASESISFQFRQRR